MVKNLPANAGDVRDTGLSLGWEDSLEEGSPMGYSLWGHKRVDYDSDLTATIKEFSDI